MEMCKNIELTKDSISFLRRLFDSYKNSNNKLDMRGLEKIFETTEKGVPWNVRQETVYDNGISLEIWIGLWQKFFYLETYEAFKTLYYIGYCGKMKQAFTMKKFRVRDLLKPSAKKVFNCYIVGLNGCGKVIYFYNYMFSLHSSMLTSIRKLSIKNN